MRKTTLATGGACLLVCALFFLAPASRQAFHLSLSQWHDVFHVTSWQREPNLEVLDLRAREKHDAEAMAFVAVRHWDALESARLAEEAVQLDPNLIWVYAVVAVRHPELSEIDVWVPRLKQWDPQNALAQLITAESIDIAQVIREQVPSRADQEDPAWQSAMAAAFQSRKLDDYSSSLKELDRKVALRYGLHDPYEVMSGEDRYGLPTYAAWDSSRFAKLLVEAGEKLEAQGNRGSASDKYWTVVRFGRILGSDAGFQMSPSLQVAYKRLGAISEQEGKSNQAELLGYLAGKSYAAREEQLISWRNGATDLDAAGWNASVVKASGMLILAFSGLVGICAVSVLARNRSKLASGSHAGSVAQVFGLVGTLGLVVASATLYVSYRPYANIFQRFISSGDESGTLELSKFLASIRAPLGVHNFYQMRDFVFYFWFGATMLGLIAVLLMGMRAFLNRSRAGAMA